MSAVLAISVVVSAFPVLSARDGPAFDQVCASSTRALLLLSWLGTAVIAAIAVPAARVLARQPDQVPELIEAFALFAPGIAGTAVISNLSRVMFALGRLKVAAAAMAGSWLLVIVADLVLAEADAAPPGGGRARAGEHDRPDRRGRPAGDRHPPDLRPGRPGGSQPRGRGGAGGRAW